MKKPDKRGESYFEAIVEAFDARVYVCSPDNRIEFVNSQVAALHGREMIGESCHKALYDRNEVCPWCSEQTVFGGKTI